MGLYPVDDLIDVDLMDPRQMPLQARFLAETFTAAEAQETAFSAALQSYVPAQIAFQRVAASAIRTNVEGCRETC